MRRGPELHFSALPARSFDVPGPMSAAHTDGWPVPPVGGATETLGVTVAICAYTDKRWDLLMEAVEAVKAQLRAGDELIIVVDYAPELLERVRERFSSVTALANGHQKGLSGARNTAVAAAVSDLVAFLDDDAVPEANWLESMRGTYQQIGVVGVGGSVLPDWQERRPWWFPDEFLWVVGCSYTGLPSTVSAIRNPIGANMSFRRSAFEAAGLFSEALGRVGTVPVGCEETELSIRVGKRFGSGCILLQPDAVVRHHVTPERATFSYFRRRCWSEGRSKATVSRLAGAPSGTSAERRYVTRTISAAISRELRLLLRGDVKAIGRAGILTFGTIATTTAFFVYRTLPPGWTR
jgi:GT2 family glycosyltransferase